MGKITEEEYHKFKKQVEDTNYLIKIDKTFVQNMLTNLKSERIVKLIVELAKQLQVNIIAEGVETESELNKLVEMGCSSIQGYLFSCPLSPPQLLQKIEYCNVVASPY